jgi:hypothetical protein
MAVKVFLFVATLGYSRRLHVRAYGHEKQDRWFDGMESAFRAFGGVPREVLLDNAKALILHHDPASREVVLHPRLHAFASHWRLRIRACTPVSRSHQGQGRAWRRLCRIERDSRAPLRQLVGAGGAFSRPGRARFLEAAIRDAYRTCRGSPTLSVQSDRGLAGQTAALHKQRLRRCQSVKQPAPCGPWLRGGVCRSSASASARSLRDVASGAHRRATAHGRRTTGR